MIIDKSCNRIIPDQPILIKEVSDSIKIIHKYDFDLNDDSIANAKLKLRLENVELAEQYDRKIRSRLANSDNRPNLIMLDQVAHDSKGYTIASGMPYFILNISSLEEKVIDFTFDFINQDIISGIYCLSLKIYKIENNKSVYVMDENYYVKRTTNLIRINNLLAKGKYEIKAGFFLLRDQDAQYPCFYNISKIVEK